MSQPLSCPFCGHVPTDEDANFETNQGTKWGFLVCPQCCAMGPEVRTGYGPPATWKAEAIAAWNRRASTEKGTMNTRPSNLHDQQPLEKPEKVAPQRSQP